MTLGSGIYLLKMHSEAATEAFQLKIHSIRPFHSILWLSAALVLQLTGTKLLIHHAPEHSGFFIVLFLLTNTTF